MKKNAKVIVIGMIAILCALSFAACDLLGGGGGGGDTNPTRYSLTVIGGTGGGTFDENAQVTVTATIPSGKVFLAWLEGETQVSTSNPYTFTLNKNTTLTATFGDDPALGTPGLAFTLTDSGESYSVAKGTATATAIVIPAAYEGKPVTEIAANGFRSLSVMTSIVLPNSLNKIGDMAFAYTNLAYIELPDSLESIGAGAFGLCKLKSVFIPVNVASIGSDAFYDDKYPQMIIYAQAESRPSGWVSGWDSCRITVSPNSSASSDQFVYWGIERSDIVAVDGMEYILRDSFDVTLGPTPIYSRQNDGTRFAVLTKYLDNTQDTLIIPQTIAIENENYSVEIIGRYAFMNCSGLTDIIIPEGVKAIDISFQICHDLTRIVIPSSMACVNYNSTYLTNLTTVYYGGANLGAWSSILKDDSKLTGATRYYYSESEPAEEGNYWRFVSNIPTAWE